VIEGFYGVPWSHQDRLDVLRFMGRVGLNVYVYAPKDDPYHRERWREPYPPDDFARLAQLAETARAEGVEFWYAISPGGSMVYSDSGDYRALLDKIDAVRALGVEHFGLFLDDVPTTLRHEADRLAFGTLAAAHASLINRLHADLAARGAQLAVTPTTYTDAWGDRAYVEQLGSEVAPDVPFFWTGIDVAAPEITAEQAERWGRLIGRKPLIWDNYPVNDYARWRPFLGPFRGRASDLARAADGIVANPMNQAHASMIALATLADYARDPAGYDPDSALRTALSALYGDTAADALEPFIEVYGDYGWSDNVFEQIYILRDTLDLAAMDAALARLGQALERLEETRPAGSEPLAPLISELAPFVERTAERLALLEADPLYERRDGLLVYRTSADRYSAVRTAKPIHTDGDLAEWNDEGWYPLGGMARVAFAADDTSLFIALRVEDSDLEPRSGTRIGAGDHVQLIIDVDPDDRRHGLTPRDLVVLIPAPTEEAGEPFVGSMRFEGFMSKWLADNERLTFSEFLLSTFGEKPTGEAGQIAQGLTVGGRWSVVGGQGSVVGYTLELALPLPDSERLRISLSVVDVGQGERRVWSLAKRNYPANPATFSEVVVR
jgi:hypothetical protein